MHSLKTVALLVCILALASFAVAANSLGIHDTGKVVFHSPTRVGGSVLPAVNTPCATPWKERST